MVNKGNTIATKAEYLTSKKVTIKWQQSLRQREADFYLCGFVNNEGGDVGPLFIQTSKLQDFKDKSKSSGEDLTVVIDDSFQYGQKADGSNRFIVFHDKNNAAYQHRFVENAITSLGSSAVDFLNKYGMPYIKMGSDLTKGFIGDYLKTF